MSESSSYKQILRSSSIIGARDGYRLRVGDWRVIYDVHDDRLVLVALELDTRGGIY